ncbi:MAG TPA: alpha/beta hydrolase [Planctomycetota bacterium]
MRSTHPPLFLTALLTALLLACAQPELRSQRASDAGREPTEHRTALATGIEMRWIELGAPQGEPVLFLHGLTDTSRSFLGTMQALTDLRPELRLIAPDLRGHGGTSLPAGAGCPADPGSCFAPSLLAADALALLDHLHVKRAHVVGHSLGSLVGQELALVHPERVERLVLIGSSARFGDCPPLQALVVEGLVEGPWKEAVLARGLAFPRDAWALEPRALPGAEAFLAENWVAEPGTDPALLAAILTETVRVPLGTWIGVPRALQSSDNRARLAALRAPTLVLAAVQDGLFPVEPVQRELCEALAGAHARHGTPWAWKRYGRALPADNGAPTDLGHNFHWAVPGAVARDLAAFLRPGGAPTEEESFLDPSGARVVHRPHGARVLGSPGTN